MCRHDQSGNLVARLDESSGDFEGDYCTHAVSKRDDRYVARAQLCHHRRSDLVHGRGKCVVYPVMPSRILDGADGETVRVLLPFPEMARAAAGVRAAK